MKEKAMSKNKLEQGRSMTEMLGVLAIIGTLSISGIAGYTYAMNKHRANEIISSVSKMAMTASIQIDLKGRFDLVEFKDLSGKVHTDNGYEVEADQPEDGEFMLTVKNVPEAVCENIVASDWKLPLDMTEDCTEGVSMEFVFSNSLNDDSGNSDSPSSGAVSSATQPVSTATQTATTTPLSSAGNEEPTASSCPAGTSTAGLGGYVPTVTDLNCYCDAKDTTYNIGSGTCSGATKPNACESNADCNSGEFCYITSSSCNGGGTGTGGIVGTGGLPGTGGETSATYSISPGTCMLVKDIPSVTDNVSNWGNLTWSMDNMSQDSANNWCQAQGKSLVKIEDLQCYRSGTTDMIEENETKGNCCAIGQDCDDTSFPSNKYGNKIVSLRQKFDYNFWTNSDYENLPCGAFYVYMGFANVASRGDSSVYALCK